MKTSASEDGHTALNQTAQFRVDPLRGTHNAQAHVDNQPVALAERKERSAALAQVGNGGFYVTDALNANRDSFPEPFVKEVVPLIGVPPGRQLSGGPRRRVGPRVSLVSQTALLATWGIGAASANTLKGRRLRLA
jgi:hypothetical protein